MRVKNFFLIVSVVLFNLSCKKSPTEPNELPTNIFPNKVGNIWVYAHHDSLSNFSDTLIVTIVGQKTISNNQPATIWQYKFPSRMDTVYVAFVGDTVRSITNNHPFRIIFPLQIGKKWNGDYWFSDTTRVLLKESISTVAGSFAESYKIVEDWVGLNDFGQKTLWFVSNVGIVRIYHIGYNFGMANETFELISYSLK